MVSAASSEAARVTESTRNERLRASETAGGSLETCSTP
jgi:hypothetical protein